MKNILFATSKENTAFSAIVKYFSNRGDILISFLTNNQDERIIREANKLKIRTYVLDNNELPNFFQTHSFDLVILDSFDKIIDDVTLETSKFIALQPSLLPKYKSQNAVKEVFYNSEVKTGITIYEVNNKLYNGKILFQKELKIKQDWTLVRLEREIKKLVQYYLPRISEKMLDINVLVVGSTSREHVVMQKISKSRMKGNLFYIGDNYVLSKFGKKIEYENYNELKVQLRENNITLAFVGDEQYVLNGFVDFLRKNDVNVVGLEEKYAKVLTDKVACKKILEKNNIKTPQYRKISKLNEIEKYFEYFRNPIVKPNNFSVFSECWVEGEKSRVKQELEKYINGKYGLASKTSIIEEKIFGQEINLYTFWDGETISNLPVSKRIRENDNNVITDGLASIFPYRIGKNNYEKIREYIYKIKEILKKEKVNSTFVLCSNILLAKDDIYILQYEIGFNISDIPAIFNYVQIDWLEFFYDLTNKMLDKVNYKYATKPYMSFDMVLEDYPYKKGNIRLRRIPRMDNLIEIYFSNLYKKDDVIFSSGPRIISIATQNKAYFSKFIETAVLDKVYYKKEVEY